MTATPPSTTALMAGWAARMVSRASLIVGVPLRIAATSTVTTNATTASHARRPSTLPPIVERFGVPATSCPCEGGTGWCLVAAAGRFHGEQLGQAGKMVGSGSRPRPGEWNSQTETRFTWRRLAGEKRGWQEPDPEDRESATLFFAGLCG